MTDAYTIVRRVERAEQTARICGETDGLREAYIEAARELGQQIAEARQALSDLANLRVHRCDPNYTLKPGTRVELHPGLDAWMQGDRYGEIRDARYSTLAGAFRYTVRLDKSGRLLRLPFDRVTAVE